MLSAARAHLAGSGLGLHCHQWFVLAGLTMGGGAAVGFLSDVVVQLLTICWSPCCPLLRVLVDVGGDGRCRGLHTMRVAFASTAALLVISMASQALAATVNATSGQVLINRGEGYTMVAGSTQANAADTIVVNPGGSAQIVYPDGCVIDVSPGSVAAIAARSPCGGGGSNSSTETAATNGVSNGTMFAIGALAVGGGVAAALFLQKDKSASP
jgi:hypothetical protein